MENAANNFGMRIICGPSNYQVIQHKNGFADISLSGEYNLSQGFFGDPVCLVRIVSETDGMEILTWTECERQRISDIFGIWNITLNNIKAGGPYRIESGITSKENRISEEFMLGGDIIHHVGIGIVIATAGQSNSQGYGKDVVYDPPEYGISMLMLSGRWEIAAHPLNDTTCAEKNCSMDILNAGHSPWLALAKSIKHYTNLPVGIITGGLGGPETNLWSPENGILFKNMTNAVKKAGGDIFCLIWYQGCLNTEDVNYDLYYEKLMKFIRAFRKQTGNKNLPVFSIQLNKCIASNDEDTLGWRTVREGQRRSANELYNVFCIPTYDLMMLYDGHSSAYGSIAIAQRVFAVMKGIIDDDDPVCAPDIDFVSTGEDKRNVTLKIKNVAGYILMNKCKNIGWPFIIEDNQGNPVKIRNCSVIDSNSILIEADENIYGKFISYMIDSAFQYVPVYDSSTRLPLLAFNRIEIC